MSDVPSFFYFIITCHRLEDLVLFKFKFKHVATSLSRHVFIVIASPVELENEFILGDVHGLPSEGEILGVRVWPGKDSDINFLDPVHRQRASIFHSNFLLDLELIKYFDLVVKLYSHLTQGGHFINPSIQFKFLLSRSSHFIVLLRLACELKVERGLARLSVLVNHLYYNHFSPVFPLIESKFLAFD